MEALQLSGGLSTPSGIGLINRSGKGETFKASRLMHKALQLSGRRSIGSDRFGNWHRVKGTDSERE